jgi:hypothetical protein
MQEDNFIYEKKHECILACDSWHHWAPISADEAWSTVCRCIRRFWHDASTQTQGRGDPSRYENYKIFLNFLNPRISVDNIQLYNMPAESRRIVSLAPKTPQVQPFDEEDFQESDHVVSYSSKNKVEKTTFQAVSSPNSRHAAKLAEIALAVQTNQTPRPHERRAALMSSSSVPRQQIQATAYNNGTYESISPQQMDFQGSNGANTFQGNYPTTAGNFSAPQQQQHYQNTSSHSYPAAQYQTPIPSSTQEYKQVPQPVQPDYPVASGTSYAPQQLQQYQGTSGYWPPATQYAATAPTSMQVSRPAQAFQQPEVTRFATEERTAYQLRGHNGSLRVSAPVGSNEARLFDEVARQNSEQRRVNYPKMYHRGETGLTELGTFKGLENCRQEDERF